MCIRDSHDPKVATAQMARDLKQDESAVLDSSGSWCRSDSIEAAVAGADAVLILTEWEQYRQLKWADLASRMRRPAWVFDARAVTESQQVRAAGLSLWKVGDGEG